MGDPVGPVGEFLVCASPAIPDQRSIVAKALRNQPICQFDPDVEPFGIIEALKQIVRLLSRDRQIVPCEGVRIPGRSEVGHFAFPSSICTASCRSCSLRPAASSGPTPFKSASIQPSCSRACSSKTLRPRSVRLIRLARRSLLTADRTAKPSSTSRSTIPVDIPVGNSESTGKLTHLHAMFGPMQCGHHVKARQCRPVPCSQVFPQLLDSAREFQKAKPQTQTGL